MSVSVFAIDILGRHGTQFREITLSSITAELFQLRGERVLSAEPSERVVARKIGIASGFELDFTLDWKTTKLPHEAGKIV